MNWPEAIVIVVCVLAATSLINIFMQNRAKQKFSDAMLRMKRLEIEHDQVRPIKGLMGEIRQTPPVRSEEGGT